METPRLSFQESVPDKPRFRFLKMYKSKNQVVLEAGKTLEKQSILLIKKDYSEMKPALKLPARLGATCGWILPQALAPCLSTACPGVIH